MGGPWKTETDCLGVYKAKTQLIRTQTINAVVINAKEHSRERLASCRRQGQFDFQACSLHSESPQNDKQKAQMKPGCHNVSETKTKTERVAEHKKNQNVNELCLKESNQLRLV